MYFKYHSGVSNNLVVLLLLHLPLLGHFDLFSGHCLHDSLVPNFSFSCSRLSVPYLEKIYGILSNSILPSISRLSRSVSSSDKSFHYFILFFVEGSGGLQQSSIFTLWPGQCKEFINRGRLVKLKTMFERTPHTLMKTNVPDFSIGNQLRPSRL